MVRLTTEQLRQVDDALNAGQKIEAIRLCREFARCGLVEAKEYVESRPAAMMMPQASVVNGAALLAALVIIVLIAGGAYVMMRSTGRPALAPTSAAAPVVDPVAVETDGQKTLDLSGAWTLTNPKKTYRVSFMQVEQGKYQMVPSGLVYSGVYQQTGDQLVMTKPASPAYADFVWKIQDGDHLELTNSQYRGSTLARARAK